MTKDRPGSERDGHLPVQRHRRIQSTRTRGRHRRATPCSWPATGRILRAAFETHAGDEQGTEGDSFFVVFASAADGIRAAIDAQHGLADEAWPEGHPVRVRMGVHTGEASFSEEGYVGIEINRTARIAAAGHGGQVVVSVATRCPGR